MISTMWMRNKVLAAKVAEVIGRMQSLRVVYNKIVSSYSRVFGRIQIFNELNTLIKSDRFVVLRPYFQMAKNDATTDEIVHDVVSDFLHVYGTVRLSETESYDISAPRGAV